MPRPRVPQVRTPKSNSSGLLDIPFSSGELGAEKPGNFSVKFDTLVDHIVIAGGQGELRTEVCKQLVGQIAATEIPFLVVTSNRSYRTLLKVEQPRQEIAFYTAGEPVLPFTVNLFEIMPGVSVAGHIARISALFKTIFDFSTPVNCAFEKTVEAAYVRRGWNLLNNENSRLTKEEDEQYQGDVYPVLSELLEILEEGVESCGFEPKVKTDVKATIQAILNPLNSGINRSVFNTRSANSVTELFQHSVVIETGALRSPQDRALFAAILLTFCEESLGPSNSSLCHLFVLDDCAHMPHLFGGESSERGEKTTVPIPANLEAFSNAGHAVIFSGLRGSQLESTRITQTGLAVVFRERNTFALSNIGAFLNLDLSAMNIVKGLGPYDLAVLSSDRVNGKHALLSLDAAMKAAAFPEGGTIPDEQVVSASRWLSFTFRPFSSAGRTYFPDAFDLESQAVAEKLVQNKFFYRVFVRYISSFTNDLTQLVHFRAQVIHEIQRIIGRRAPDVLRKISWCAISLASDKYFGDKALISHWSLDEERNILQKWYGLLAPAFVPEAVNSSLNRKLNIVQVRSWRDEFLASQEVDQGPLPACGACTAKCLYGYDVQQFLADPGLFFDFNATISRRDTPASESSAWFVRLLCERLIEAFNLDLAYCLAVHLIKAQQLSTDAQLVLLRKVHQHLLVVNSEGETPDPGAKSDEVRIIQFPKIIKDR